MERINCWVYPGKKDVMLITDEKLIAKMPVPHDFICKLVGDNETGVWSIEVHNDNRSRWADLLIRYDSKVYIRMPDGGGFDLDLKRDAWITEV
jgi:hypothetical protein